MASREPQTRLAPGFIRDLQDEILAWYEERGRRLPWRATTDPYHILVSELMLQQTQVDRVLPKYESFLEKFPTLESLATAPLSDVLVVWSGLGYNRRAKYLCDLARAIVERGSFPETVDELLKLPGVGPYTARAVAVFAMGIDEVLLETNTRRVYQLLFTGDDQDEVTLTVLAHQLLPPGRSRDWHHALMDIGSLAGRQRSAAAQQEFLVALFPMLDELNLPTFAEDQVVRPRQSPFEGSKRQIRGSVLRELGNGPLPESELAELVGDERLDEVLSDLESEGFIQRVAGSVSLK